MARNPIRTRYNIYFHGKAKYGDDWPKIRETILIRDGRRCRICGKNKSLHIHHIIAFKISHSNESLNLVSVCRSCHRKVENFAWKLLEKGAHRFQIYEAVWRYISEQQKLLTESKSESVAADNVADVPKIVQ
jgi:hypothetical protein